MNDNQQAHTDVNNSTLLPVVNIIEQSETQMRAEVLKDGKTEHLLHLASDINMLTEYRYGYVYEMKRHFGAEADAPKAGVAFASAAPGFTDKENIQFLDRYLFALRMGNQNAPRWLREPEPSAVNHGTAWKPKEESPSSIGSLLRKQHEKTNDARKQCREALTQAARDAGLEVRVVEIEAEDLLTGHASASEVFGTLFGSKGAKRTTFVREDIGLTVSLKDEAGGIIMRLENNKTQFRPMQVGLHVCPVTQPFAVQLLQYLGQAKSAIEVNRTWAVFSLFMNDSHPSEEGLEDAEIFVEPGTLQFYLASRQNELAIVVDPFSELVYTPQPEEARRVLRETEGDMQARMTALKQLPSGELCIRRRGDLMKLTSLLIAMFKSTDFAVDMFEVFVEMERMF